MATSRLALNDAASPPASDDHESDAAREAESNAALPDATAAEPEQRMSLYDGSIIAVWHPLRRGRHNLGQADLCIVSYWAMGDPHLALALQAYCPNPYTLDLTVLTCTPRSS